MSVNISVSLPDYLRSYRDGLPAAKRVAMSQAAGMGVKECVTEYLRKIAGERHTTAERLGAAPSNHLAQAAEKVANDPDAVTATESSATFTINHVGMIRALRDVTIVPTTAQALAIPVNALAYNRRPAQFPHDAMFVWKSRTTGNAFLAMRQSDKSAPLLLMYLLVRSVHQKQDRTLLPSNEALATAAARAAKLYIKSGDAFLTS